MNATIPTFLAFPQFAPKRGEIEKINLRLQTLLDSFWDGIIDRETYVAEKTKGMSQKKSLEEQRSALLKGQADWLEPFQKWILTAKNAVKSLFRVLFKRRGFLPKKSLARTLSSIAKKPVVIASNRGLCCLSPVKLVEWCPRQDLNLYDFTH